MDKNGQAKLEKQTPQAFSKSCLTFLLFSLLSIFKTISFVHPATLVVADFNSGSDPITIGPSSNLTSSDSSLVRSYAVHSGSEPAHGNRGYSLKIQYLNDNVDAFLLLNFGGEINLSNYRSLSFWVRGASGGEDFKINLERTSSLTAPSYRPNVKEFMVGGITSSWQKVNIPLKAIFKEQLTESYNGLSDTVRITLNFTGSTPAETVYIDDVFFHTKSGNVMVDNFDDGANPMVFGFDPFDYVPNGTGAGFTRTFDTANAYGGSGKAYKIVWTTGTGAVPSPALTAVTIDTQSTSGNGKIGIDVTGCNVISLHLKGEPAGALLGLGLADDGTTEKIHATSITITNSYQDVTRTLSEFAISLASVSVFELWAINDTTSKGPPIDLLTPVTFYIDNVRFLDTSSPTTPTTFFKNGVAVGAGIILTSTDVFTVTADAAGTDSTIERIRFEHDNLTGGASWYLIKSDTDTTDATYSGWWENFNDLIPGTSYQLRVAAEDVAGNETRTTPVTGVTLLSPQLSAATSMSGTALSKTSIQWSWVDNATSESGYRVFSSTGGQVSPDLAPNTASWTETNLSPNTRYFRFVKAFGGQSSPSASSTVGKYTLANPASSIGITDRNSNSLTVSWSTASGGNEQFVLQRAADSSGSAGTFVAIATMSGNSLSYQDSGLTSNTTYWYRVIGYNGDLIATDPSSSISALTSGMTISHTPLTSIGILGNDVVVSASVSNSRTIQSVTLFYREKGQSSFNSASFSPAPNSTLYTGSATISASFIRDTLDNSGFEYIIVASDSLLISSSPSSGVHSVTVSETITAPPIGTNGGTVTISDGDPFDGETGLVIPTGALSGSVEVSVKQLSVQSVPKIDNVAPVSVYEFGPTGLQFAQPVTMTLLYMDKNQDGIVDGTTLSESTLKFFWYDGFAWRNLGGTVNTTTNIVIAKVSHFSTFGLFSAPDPTESEVRPKEKIITPNGDGINDFVQFGISGSFEISIFNIRGKRIQKLGNVNVWNGRDEDGAIVESGVYLYQVKSDRFTVSGTIGVAR